MKGWLVVNNYLRQKKHEEIYSLIKSAFSAEGLDIEIKTNAALMVDTAPNAIKKADFVVYWDKDILLARHLQSLGYWVLNSADAIETCDNKGLTAIRLINQGIKMPRTVIAPFCYDNIGYGGDYGFLRAAADKIGFPMVVKESFGSFGAQVYYAADYPQLEEIALRLGAKPFIMQEFVKSSFGRDARIQVVGGHAVAAVLRRGAAGDFRANATAGGTMEHYDFPPEFGEMAVKVCQEIGLDFAGVDILFGDNGEPVLCEVNSNAHFKNLLNATGINTAQLLAQYIKTKKQK